MILNIDFNPGIDRCLYLDRIKLGSKNLLIDSDTKIYGSGMELEFLLNKFDLNSLLTGFIGFKNREIYGELMPKNVETAFIGIKDDVHERTRIIEKTGEETILSRTTRLTKDEITEFINIYDSLLNDSEYVVGFDNLTEELPKNFYEKLIKIAYMKDKKFILELLKTSTIPSLEEKPSIVVTNKDMLEKVTNLYLEDYKSIGYAINSILEKGIDSVFINLYEEGVVYGDLNHKYHIKKDESKNTLFLRRLNHGLIAGILIGYKRGYTLDMMLELSFAYNYVYNNNYNMEDIYISEIKKLMSNARLNELI